MRPLVDQRILGEYREVLARPRLKLPKLVRDELMRRFAEVVEHVAVSAAAVSRLDRIALPDPDDRAFMEVALSGAAAAIVTGNASHYPAGDLEPVRVITPRQLLVELGAP